MWLGMEEGFLFSRTHFFSSSRNHLVKVITFYSYLSLFVHICILLKYVHICKSYPGIYIFYSDILSWPIFTIHPSFIHLDSYSPDLGNWSHLSIVSFQGFEILGGISQKPQNCLYKQNVKLGNNDKLSFLTLFIIYSCEYSHGKGYIYNTLIFPNLIL